MNKDYSLTGHKLCQSIKKKVAKCLYSLKHLEHLRENSGYGEILKQRRD